VISLFAISLIVEFAALLITLWLGLYLVTRSPRQPEAWLAALTSWSISGLFLNMIYSVIPPAIATSTGTWLEILLFLWPRQLLAGSGSAWLQGWSATPAIIFWYHATALMHPGKMTLGRSALVMIGYVLALAGISLQVMNPSFYAPISGDLLFLNALHGKSVYAVFLGVLIVYCCLSIYNLGQTARAEPRLLPRRQAMLLAAATVFAALTGPMGMIAAFFNIPVPMFLIAALISMAVLVTGFGVARYNALVENRIFTWDFYYTAGAVSTAVVFCLAVTWITGQFYEFPPFLYVNIGCLAVISYTSVDAARKVVDFRFLQQENRSLRDRLRRLKNDPVGSDILQTLVVSLETMVKPTMSEYALLFLRNESVCELVAVYRWENPLVQISPELLGADDFKRLEKGDLPAPLTSAALLFPIYTGDRQIGALILGPTEHGADFSPVEIERLLDCNDYLAGRLEFILLQRRLMIQMSETSLPVPSPVDMPASPITPQVVDQALRSIHEYARLAELPLAKLKLVQRKLNSNPSHIEVGESVYRVMLMALEKLHPKAEQGRPAKNAAISRDWYPFIILQEAYVDCLPNREIMAKLYISEGTFNRTRRSAIHSLTRLLIELEQEAS